MELARSPRGIAHGGSVEVAMPGGKLVGELIDLTNDKPVRRSISGTEVSRVVPLEVELDPVAPHASVFRIGW